MKSVSPRDTRWPVLSTKSRVIQPRTRRFTSASFDSSYGDPPVRAKGIGHRRFCDGCRAHADELAASFVDEDDTLRLLLLRDRDEIHPTDRAFPRPRLPDRWVHRARVVVDFAECPGAGGSGRRPFTCRRALGSDGGRAAALVRARALSGEPGDERFSENDREPDDGDQQYDRDEP